MQGGAVGGVGAHGVAHQQSLHAAPGNRRSKQLRLVVNGMQPPASLPKDRERVLSFERYDRDMQHACRNERDMQPFVRAPSLSKLEKVEQGAGGEANTAGVCGAAGVGKESMMRLRLQLQGFGLNGGGGMSRFEGGGREGGGLNGGGGGGGGGGGVRDYGGATYVHSVHSLHKERENGGGPHMPLLPRDAALNRDAVPLVVFFFFCMPPLARP